MNKSIVWGACWFNEPVETVANFYIKTREVLEELGLKVYPVVFAAKKEHDKRELRYLLDKVNDMIVLVNSVNIFPNKNYGVAAITNVAYKLDTSYIAVVDPDWSINEFESFVSNILTPILNNKADIVIPDIVSAAGRSNLFLGKTAISLFYPEYKDVIKTAFPGSFVALTNKMHEIVGEKAYHFDWGGEWDIISFAIDKGMKIASMPVEVENIRHRPNTSKIFDAFQIWRAILCNKAIKNRYNNISKYTNVLEPYNEFSKKMLSGRYTVLEQIELVNEYGATDTEKQLLYMILYPLGVILGDIETIPYIEKNTQTPYAKEEIYKVAELGIYCAQSALLCSNKTIEQINDSANKVTGDYFGNWNYLKQQQALSEMLGGI